MSQEAVEAFLKRIEEDDDLSQRARDLDSGPALIVLGKDYGFELTTEEAASFLMARDQDLSDDDLDGVVDTGETRLRMWDALSVNATVTATGNEWVTFDNAGAADGLHTLQLGQSDATGTAARCVTVTGPGNIRMKRGTCP